MRIPSSTYRIQFHKGFTFSDVRKEIDYLHKLGITDLYASPIFASKPGSNHGYDVIDSRKINPELGGREGFESLREEMSRFQMGWLQDIVPNHMAVDGGNLMLMDVLESGANSIYRDFFDIEWDHPYENLRGRMLAPVLGGYYWECLERGEISIEYDDKGFSVRYYEHRFPLGIEFYADVLTKDLSGLRNKIPEDHPDFVKFLGVLFVLKTLATAEEVEERQAQILFAKRVLWELYQRSEVIAEYIQTALNRYKGTPGDPVTYNELDHLLSKQHFRLAFWKVATQELNYRRFFTVNDLISLRVEDENVFRNSHDLILEMVQNGMFTGLRIDHIDGLYDPQQYLGRLQDFAGSVYVLVEKILEYRTESLPVYWSCMGTTGYDFLNAVNSLFCSRRSSRDFTRIYRAFTRNSIDSKSQLRRAKRLIVQEHLAGDVDRLALHLRGIASMHRYGSDITLSGLRDALAEMLANFQVYRTYVSGPPTTFDKRQVRVAVAQAKHYKPTLEKELEFLQRFLLLMDWKGLDSHQKSESLKGIMRFQQLTGPVMAKGMEDTFLYGYSRLLSLNDVGGNPFHFGINRKDFHAFNQRRLRKWPHTQNCTSTHDTKRGEDARARLNVLSEIPEEWEKKVRYWSKLNFRNKIRKGQQLIPFRNDEYFFYQAILGSWPMPGFDEENFQDRVNDYIIKALREAKINSTWLKPDNTYEQACIDFTNSILNPSPDNTFLEDLRHFAGKISFFGIMNSLSQTLLKITSPGVPDFYQGSEFWDLSFVDPDNRRPIEFEWRKQELEKLEAEFAQSPEITVKNLLSNPFNPRVKLFVIWKALQFRNQNRELFHSGTYTPLEFGGSFSRSVLGFSRASGNENVMILCPRMVTNLTDEQKVPLGQEIWKDTQLYFTLSEKTRWKDVFTGLEYEIGGNIPVGELFSEFPLAMLSAVH